MISNKGGSLLILTGGNRGLGYALINEALKTSVKVITLARSLHKDHEQLVGNQLLFFHTDMAKPFDSSELDSYLDRVVGIDNVYVILNAAVIAPLTRIGDYEVDELATSIATNISYNVALVNFVKRRFPNSDLCFVNISSGASRKAIENWGLYCASKSYMEMFFEILRLETQGNGRVSVFSIDPGAMDTGMQQAIRTSTAPSREYFESLSLNRKLKKADQAAREVLNAINFIK
jgi:benzil reductase ((S)-benzoin forming)